MRLSHKIFLGVFLSTLAVGGGLLWTSYYYLSGQIKEDFVGRYSVFSTVLSDALTQLDKRTEHLMFNAAKFVAEVDSQKGLLSTEELKSHRDDLGVTHIFIVNNKGKFIRSTNESPELIPNAFSFCPAYEDLVTGKSNIEASPIVHPDPEPKPYKFLFIPNKERSRLVEVGVRIDFIADTLAKALESDSNVRALSLYSPKGKAFGTISAGEIEFNDEDIRLPTELPSYSEHKGHVDFYTKVTASHPQCCQCDVAGTSVNGEYYYVLKSSVSKEELSTVMASANKAFILFGIGNFVLALILGRLLSAKLVKNIEEASHRIQQIKDSGSLKGRVRLEGKDEVSFLTNEFDRMLDVMEENQHKILEAERTEAKVKVARQVAHNILSPTVAIEMLLPMLNMAPERVVSVLKSSVSEIKNLAAKLREKNIDFAEELECQQAEISLVFLPHLLDEVVSQKKVEFSDREDLHLSLIVSPDQQGLYSKVDPTTLKSIISNLVNNSMEAVGVGEGSIEILLSGSSDSCQIEVRDTGAGIPEEYLERLGREPITFKGSQGRGLGLVHAFESVHQMGGEIKVESIVGQGTTVKIRLKSYLETSSWPCLEGSP